jgi:hypothetical protein
MYWCRFQIKRASKKNFQCRIFKSLVNKIVPVPNITPLSRGERLAWHSISFALGQDPLVTLWQEVHDSWVVLHTMKWEIPATVLKRIPIFLDTTIYITTIYITTSELCILSMKAGWSSKPISVLRKIYYNLLAYSSDRRLSAKLVPIFCR